MARIKKRLTQISDTDIFDDISKKDARGVLRQAWEDMPNDYASDRFLFMELAEKLISIADDRKNKVN